MSFLDFWKKEVSNEKNFTHKRDRLELVNSILEKKKMVIELNQLTQLLAQNEIANWRQANQMALNIENPTRFQLYNIYYDAMLDDHLLGAIRNRKLKVMQRRFKVVDAKGTENEELTQLLQKRWFKKFMSLALDSIFYGHSLIQLDDIIRDDNNLRFSDVELVPRQHVKPEYHVIIKDVSDEPKQGKDYLKPPFSDWCIPVGDPKNLGLLLPVSKDTISKKYALQFWDQFAELFGMPIRIGKSSTRNKKDIDQVEKMLEDMGSAAWGLFPEGTEIEVVETKRGDAFNVYDKRIERANTEMSKAILGQTMTMDNGSSKSQAEVHAGVAEYISEADADFLHDVINDDLLPVLIVHGWPLTGYRFAWDDTTEYTPDEMRQVEQMLLSEYDIDPDYFIEKYGIKITAKKQTTVPTNLVAEKKKPLINLVNRPEFPEPCCDDHTILLAATKRSEIDNSLIRYVWDNRDASYSFNYFRWLADAYVDALVRGWKGEKALKLGKFKTPADIGLDYAGSDDMTFNIMELNIFRFSAAKSAAAVTELNRLTRENDTFSKFRKQAENVTKLYNESYLQTEYNFAWNTGHTSAAYHRMMAQKEAFPTWMYQTAGDARVRDAHQALQGKKFKAGEMDSVYPPNGWGCRCYVKPLQGTPGKFTTETEAQDILAKHGFDKKGMSEWDRMVKNRFNVNRAKSKVIYDEDKFYVKEQLGTKLTWKDQGLKAFAELNKAKLPEAKTKPLTTDEALTYLSKRENILSDYNGRKMVLNTKTLKAHNKPDRLELITSLDKILAAPDEVYMGEKGSNNAIQLRYIKFYKNKPIVVISQIDDSGMQVKTWFEADKEKIDRDWRQGILIKKTGY